MENITEKQESFMKKHADAAAIIGVLLAFMALLISMWLSHASRMDAVNTRMDNTYNLIQQEMKNYHQEMKDFHGRICILEEKVKK